MYRSLPLATTLVLALLAALLVGPSVAATTGTISFSGRVIDPTQPLVQGSVVTVHGAVTARAEACVETRVEVPGASHAAPLWLCSTDAQAAARMPRVGEPVNARARITGVRTSPGGEVPVSDSFVLTALN